MFGRDARSKFFIADLFLAALHPLRDQQVYAVRFTLDLFVDPIQLDFQSFRRQADSTQHAEAACVRHYRDHVAAERESEKREIDSRLPETCVVNFLDRKSVE